MGMCSQGGPQGPHPRLGPTTLLPWRACHDCRRSTWVDTKPASSSAPSSVLHSMLRMPPAATQIKYPPTASSSSFRCLPHQILLKASVPPCPDFTVPSASTMCVLCEIRATPSLGSPLLSVAVRLISRNIIPIPPLSCSKISLDSSTLLVTGRKHLDQCPTHTKCSMDASYFPLPLVPPHHHLFSISYFASLKASVMWDDFHFYFIFHHPLICLLLFSPQTSTLM